MRNWAQYLVFKVPTVPKQLQHPQYCVALYKVMATFSMPCPARDDEDDKVDYDDNVCISFIIIQCEAPVRAYTWVARFGQNV